MGRFSPMCTDFLFVMMKNFWKWVVVMVAQFVNILNATELCV